MSLHRTRQSLRHWPAWLVLSLALLAPMVPLNAASAPGVSRVQGAQDAGATQTQYPVLTAGTTSASVIRRFRVDDDGALTVAPGASQLSAQVEGVVAGGTVSTGVNPIAIGVQRASTSTIEYLNADVPADAATNARVAPYVNAYGSVFNGTTWDRARSTTTGVAAVGKFITEVSDSSAVQAAAYAANDLVGGKRTFANAVRASGGTAIVKGVTIVDQAANSAANSVYDLILFNSDPTGTTFTENSPLDVADADMSKVLAVIRLDGVAGSTLFTNVDNNALYKAVEVAIVQSGTSSLFAALIARGAPTFAATTDVVVKLQIEQN